jgi:hypothetical protein
MKTESNIPKANTATATTPVEKLAIALEQACPEYRLSETLSGCLSATSTSRSGAIEPNWSVRLQAVGMILDHRFGKPIQRQEIVTKTLDTDGEANLRERLKKSPALRKALRELLEDGDRIDV